MTHFSNNKRRHCRTGALLLLAGLVLAGTVPGAEGFSEIPAGSLTASAQELDIESIEAMQEDEQSGNTPANAAAETDTSIEAADGRQTVSSSSDTLAGYGQSSAAQRGDLDGNEPDTDDPLAGDGQNTDSSVNSESSFTDEKLTSVLTQIQASLPSSGDWSVYVCDLKTGAQGSINDHRMQAASLIKLYIMGAVYENYDALITQYGQDTIDANLYSMITVSDNDAANALTTYLGSGDSSAGMQAVNDYCLKHGYTTSSMGRLLLHSNEFGDNYTSAANCGAFLKMVYWNGYRKEAAPKNQQPETGSENEQAENFAGGSVTEGTSASVLTPHASDMFSLLCAQTRRHKIPAYLPDGVHTANKTGELDDVENDAAILYDTANDLIIVFMSEYLDDCGAAQSTIASLSREIYDAYQ